jgi:hypothetical protein
MVRRIIHFFLNLAGITPFNFYITCYFALCQDFKMASGTGHSLTITTWHLSRLDLATLGHARSKMTVQFWKGSFIFDTVSGRRHGFPTSK